MMAGMAVLARRIRLLFLLTGFVLLNFVAVRAQQIEMSENFARQIDRIEFRVTSGRIVARSSTFGGRLSSSTQVDGQRERLTIDFAGGLPTIDYLRSSADEQLTIHVSPTTPPGAEGDVAESLDVFPPVLGSDQIHIVRVPMSDGSPLVPIEFHQQPNRSLVLIVGAEGERREVRAATLWYLLLTEPELCREHLGPLLALLRDDWRLFETAAAIESGMYEAVEQQLLPDRHRWADLVEALASDDFGTRQAADRALRQIGRVAVPYLESLPAPSLDAEQRFRIRRIITAVALGDSEDTAASMSLLAACDPRAWVALLDHQDPSRRRMAFEQLGDLLDEPVTFDPTGPAAERRLQVEELRRRFESPEATASP